MSGDFFAWRGSGPTVTDAVEPNRPVRADSDAALIDCDVHNRLQNAATLRNYLPRKWRSYHETYGLRAPHLAAYLPTPRAAAARTDSWPPRGGPPGSDLAFMQEQLLDRWNISYAVLNPLDAIRFAEEFREYSAALMRALNEWLEAEWLAADPRFVASICVAFEEPDLAVREIRRLGESSRFVQVLANARTRAPLGNHRYWRIYEIAESLDLPIAVHVGGIAGHTVTGAGMPSYYFEDHGGYPQAFQAQLTSMIAEGVFERFPRLKVIFLEGGFSWIAPLMWRLDAAWRLLHKEIPQVRQEPSSYIREHLWVTTQPIEEPERPEYFMRAVNRLGMDHAFLFSTDYPHWDFDAPDATLPRAVSADFKRKVFTDNAKALYGFTDE